MNQQLLPFNHAVIIDIAHHQIVVVQNGKLRGYGGTLYKQFLKELSERIRRMER